MITCTAKEAADRLTKLQMHQVVGAGKNCLFKLEKVRGMIRVKPMTEIEMVAVERFTELLSLSLGTTYETESLLLVAEIEIIRDQFSEVRKSIALLKEMDDEQVECEESDSDFYNQYALYALENR